MTILSGSVRTRLFLPGVVLSLGCGWLGAGSSPPAATAAPTTATSSDAEGQPSSGATLNPEFACPDSMVYIPGSEELDLKPYCIDRTEVTVAQYAECVAANACSDIPLTGSKDDDGDGKNDFEDDPGDPLGLQVKFWRENCGGPHQSRRQDHPMDCVFWIDAVTYCHHAGKLLPDATHWVWAANGAQRQPKTYPWGDESPQADHACWSGGGNAARPSTCPVGSVPKDATPQGVLDMAGNVPEWTTTSLDMKGNPTDGDGVAKAVYGGGWRTTYQEHLRHGARKRGGGPTTNTTKDGQITGSTQRRLDLRTPTLGEGGDVSGIGLRCMWQPGIGGQ